MPGDAWPRSRIALELRPSRCLEVARPGARCGRCRSVCVSAALPGPGGPDPRPHCTGCLACARACPTGAIDLSKVALEALEASWDEVLQAGSDSCTIVCSPASRGQGGRLVQECLGGCTTRTLMIPLERGVEKLELLAGDCERCPSVPMMSGLEATLDEVGRLAALAGLRGAVERVQPERRGLWRKLFRPHAGSSGGGALVAGMRGRLKAAVEERPAALEGSGPPPSREWLRRLAVAGAPASSGETTWASGPGLPVGRAQIDYRCTGCAACSRVCPTGALIRTRAGEVVTIEHVGARCVGCAACAAVCVERAITVEPAAALATLGHEEAMLLYKRTARRCVICGCRLAPDASGALACPPCTKRYSRLDIQSAARRAAARAAGAPSERGLS